MAAAVTGIALAVQSPASAAVGGNVLLEWSVPNAPSGGLTDITFPITVNPATAHRTGVYYAQQFHFQTNNLGYTGLQPRFNRNGGERLRGVFSVFGDGTSTSDGNCHAGADGGAGVSCGVEFDAVYGHKYDLKVERTDIDTWTGTAVDTVSGKSVHIGTYKVSSGGGNIQPSQAGFVEYYEGVPSCSSMPRTDVVFGGPTSTNNGGLSGTSKALHEYNGCEGQSNYQATQAGNGTHITRGSTS